MNKKSESVLCLLRDMHRIVDRMQHPATLRPRKDLIGLIREAGLILNPPPPSKNPRQKTLAEQED